MFKARNRSFRQRSGASDDKEEAADAANNAPAAAPAVQAGAAASGAPAASVSQKPAKAALSFGEEEEADADAPVAKMRPFQRSAAARESEPRERDGAAAAGGPGPAQPAYRPAAGEYTAERMAELKRNSFFFAASAAKGAGGGADDAAATRASHDRHVHFAAEGGVETAAGDEAERLEREAQRPASDVLSQIAALREGGAGTGAAAATAAADERVLDGKRSETARTLRQRTRQGEGSGFISLDSSKAEGDEAAAPRLLAEDENDAEEEAFDDYGGKSIAFGPAAQARAQKAQKREAVAAVAADADEEADEQLQWETEQMRKAAGRQLTGAQAALVAAAAAANREGREAVPSAFPALPAPDADSRVADALAELRLRHEQHTRERAQAVDAERAARAGAAETEGGLRTAQRQREFFHSLRLFLTPLLACLAHKAPQVDALALRVTAASTAVGEARAAVPIDWSAADAADFHFNDAEEADDAQVAQRSPALADALAKRAAVEEEVRSVFADTSAEYAEVGPLLERMAAWRGEYGATFADAYAALALHTLAAPYLRRDLLLWRPVDDAPTPVDSLPTFRAAADFAVAAAAADGSDEALLLPRLVESHVAPRAAHLLGLYRPLSGRQTERALALFAQLADEPLPVLRPLAAAVLAALTAAVAALLASEAAHAAAPPTQRFWRVAKLYRHVCAWHPYLAAPALHQLALGSLLPRLLPLLPSVPPSALSALLDATPPPWLATALPHWAPLRSALADLQRRASLSAADAAALGALAARLPR